MAQSDLVECYKLETEFFHHHVRHTRYAGEAKNRDEKIEEDWINCGELGEGGFGVVHKQVQETTGRYRAVKKIDKRPPLRLDYSRELLVMAILAKVGVLIPEEFCLSLLSCCDLMLRFLASVTIRPVLRMVRGARDTVYCYGISQGRRS